MTATLDIRRTMAEANPVPDDPNSASSVVAIAMLERILATPNEPKPTTRRFLRRPVLVRIGAAAAAFSVAFLGLQLVSGDDQAFAATPKLLDVQSSPTSEGAREALIQIAGRVDGLPDDTGTGAVAVVNTQFWSLSTQIDGQQVTSDVVPQDTVTRTEADGTAEVTKEYRIDGDDRQESQTVRRALDFGLRSLSPDDVVLERQLAIGHPAASGTSGRFDAVVDAYRQMPVEPDVRAGMLRYLADSPDVKTVGQVEDRLGRIGVGFTVDSDATGLPTRYMVIVDPRTGQLLGYEEMLTSDAGRLNVEVPAVIQYVAFRDADYVN